MQQIKNKRFPFNLPVVFCASLGFQRPSVSIFYNYCMRYGYCYYCLPGKYLLPPRPSLELLLLLLLPPLPPPRRPIDEARTRSTPPTTETIKNRIRKVPTSNIPCFECMREIEDKGCVCTFGAPAEG